MFGLSLLSGFSTSLFFNLKGVATAVIAVVIFKESAGKRYMVGSGLHGLGRYIIGMGSKSGQFNLLGPLMIVLSMVCWGIDNNSDPAYLSQRPDTDCPH